MLRLYRNDLGDRKRLSETLQEAEWNWGHSRESEIGISFVRRRWERERA